jgi:hypothetical protein
MSFIYQCEEYKNIKMNSIEYFVHFDNEVKREWNYEMIDFISTISKEKDDY